MEGPSDNRLMCRRRRADVKGGLARARGVGRRVTRSHPAWCDSARQLKSQDGSAISMRAVGSICSDCAIAILRASVPRAALTSSSADAVAVCSTGRYTSCSPRSTPFGFLLALEPTVCQGRGGVARRHKRGRLSSGRPQGTPQLRMSQRPRTSENPGSTWVFRW